MINAWLPWIVAAVLAAVALSVLSAYVFARLWARPASRPVDRALGDPGLPLEPTSFQSGGDQLQGWYLPAGTHGDRRPLAILAHGWSHNRARMLPIAHALHQAGLAVLLFDARGHGESAGRAPITLRHFVEDQLAAVSYGRSLPGVDPERIAIVGHSFGAAAAILTGSIDRRIRAVVAIAPFADPGAVTRRALDHFHLPVQPLLWLSSLIFRRWLGLPMRAFTPLARVQRLTVPLLLIHGESDRMIPVSASHELASRANGHGETLFIEGAGHGSVLHSSQVQSRIGAFLHDQLSAPSQATPESERLSDDPLRQRLSASGELHLSEIGAHVTAAP